MTDDADRDGPVALGGAKASAGQLEPPDREITVAWSEDPSHLDLCIDATRKALFHCGVREDAMFGVTLLLTLMGAMLVFGQAADDTVTVPIVQLDLDQQTAAQVVLLLASGAFFLMSILKSYARFLGLKLVSLMMRRFRVPLRVWYFHAPTAYSYGNLVHGFHRWGKSLHYMLAFGHLALGGILVAMVVRCCRQLGWGSFAIAATAGSIAMILAGVLLLFSPLLPGWRRPPEQVLERIDKMVWWSHLLEVHSRRPDV